MAKRVKTPYAIWLAFVCTAQAAELHGDAAALQAKPAATLSMAGALAPDVVAVARESAFRRPTDSPPREPALARAIGRAGKQGIVERSMEAYTEVLIQCQQNKSPILTVPFQRADSQQAHCYRF